MPEPRSGWESRTAAYRARLIGAGRSGKLTGEPLTEQQVAAYWAAGGDLRGGRGHKPARPSSAAPTAAAGKAAVGLDSAKDRKALERWRKSRAAPKWLPRDPADMDAATAATLSAAPVPPSRWKSVQLEYLKSGQVRMTVQPKGRGYPFELMLRDADAAHDVARMISGLNYPGMTFGQSGEGYKAPATAPRRPPEGPKPKPKAKRAKRPAKAAKRPQAPAKAAKRPARPEALEQAAELLAEAFDLGAEGLEALEDLIEDFLG